MKITTLKIKRAFQWLSVTLTVQLVLSGMTSAAPTNELIQTVKELSNEQSNSRTYVFTAPPRGNETKLFGPVADYLTQATGEKWIYRSPHGYLAYQKDTIEDHSDLFFDGAHFSAWRIKHNGHKALASLPHPMIFKVIVNRVVNFPELHSEHEMVKAFQGQKVCLQNPPNFATLSFLSHFSNPMRQPILIPTKGINSLFERLQSNECLATIMPSTLLDKLDNNRSKVRVVHTHQAYPNLSFTISPKVPEMVVTLVQKALLAPESKDAMSLLIKTYAKGKELIKPDASAFSNVSKVLANSYGFGYDFKRPVSQSYSR